jgi:1-acyl-sn-glycerol-3-phosphate acyltransferase
MSIASVALVLGKTPRLWNDRLIMFWCEGVLWLFGVRVIEKGRQNIPRGPCLYIFTHTSFFDIFSMSAKLEGMRFGAKIELFKIPFFGLAMRTAGVLPITRHNREKVFRVYERAGSKVSQGQQYALAPEGKRNTEEKLLPFKSGPFVFAIGAQMPLVPVIIKGACAVLPKNGILPNWKNWRAEISLEYLPAVSVEGYTRETRAQLQQQVYELMKPYFPGS